MFENITEFFPEERSCSYLPHENSFFRYFYVEKCSQSFYQILLERGWRRFGNYFFVPICKACNQCISIRTVISEFEISKNHKRVITKNKNTKLLINRPTMRDDVIALYDKYHAYMSGYKGWEYGGVRFESFKEMFVEGHLDYGFEFSYYELDRLIAIGYVDVLPQAISAVYFFYDHEFKDRSLGVYSILKQIELGRKMGVPYIYPGYWIDGHHSMGYKERFRPFEVLENRPDVREVAIWKPYEETHGVGSKV